MTTVYDSLSDLDGEIRETALASARQQGLPEKCTDPVAMAAIAAAVGDWVPRSKNGSGEKEPAA